MTVLKHFRKHLPLLILAVLTAGTMSLSTQAAVLGTGTQSYRISVLNAIGCADSSDLSDESCTRAEFAKMLVMSSTYKDTAATTLTSAAANDVPASYSGAQYIKTALINGWMRTRLGGNFAPDQPVTMNDAAKAALTILGYTDSDFSSNIAQERLALFKSLKLNDGVSRVSGTDTLSKSDCVSVIYNLLRTKSKGSNSIYGTAINLTLADDNELNATNLIEDYLSGPILVKSFAQVSSSVPFDTSTATWYYNGSNTGTYGKMYTESLITNNGWAVIYYNEASRTIWVYGRDAGSNAYHCVSGKVTSIRYSNENLAAPSSVFIDSTEYTLNSSDVKFMFSLNGSIKVGDSCILICKENTETSSDEEEMTEYYAVGVVKWDQNSDGSTSGTIIAQDVGKTVTSSSSASAAGPGN